MQDSFPFKMGQCVAQIDDKEDAIWLVARGAGSPDPMVPWPARWEKGRTTNTCEREMLLNVLGVLRAEVLLGVIKRCGRQLDDRSRRMIQGKKAEKHSVLLNITLCLETLLLINLPTVSTQWSSDVLRETRKMMRDHQRRWVLWHLSPSKDWRGFKRWTTRVRVFQAEGMARGLEYPEKKSKAMAKHQVTDDRVWIPGKGARILFWNKVGHPLLLNEGGSAKPKFVIIILTFSSGKVWYRDIAQNHRSFKQVQRRHSCLLPPCLCGTITSAPDFHAAQGREGLTLCAWLAAWVKCLICMSLWPTGRELSTSPQTLLWQNWD